MQFPPRLDIANTPTPLHHLARTSAELGVEFYIKRDDMTGAELSGNKIRKLEFLLADAIEEGCDTVITGGGQQSNHCRATALAATRMGLASVVCLRVEDKEAPPRAQGNILLDRLSGAEIVWIDHDDWARQQEVYEEQATRLRAAGRKTYIIPEGGSNAIGTWGYIRCSEELAIQLGELPVKDTTIVYACGSGGTGAGLVLGGKFFDFAKHQTSVVGINVCDDADYFVKRISGICDDFTGRYPGVATAQADDIRFIDGYVGAGYAKSQPAELTCLRALAARDAIILDPVYTGKAFYGITQELAKDPTRFGKRVVFLHTGGIFGLFGSALEAGYS
ncbi:MAG: D-cysteine desulfhydrase family protein [Myxococcales bacterium]|nr:D-cysteine desulfhydrase family protein [Myxococcales bacterium]